MAAARPASALIEAAGGLAQRSLRSVPAPARLAEVLATGDLHVVPLKTGLASVSVPSKTYSILAAGRPLLASIDPGTEVARIVEPAGCGRAGAARRPGGVLRGASTRCSPTPRAWPVAGADGPRVGRGLGFAGRRRRARTRRCSRSWEPGRRRFADVIRQMNRREGGLPCSLAPSWVKHRPPRRSHAWPRRAAARRSASRAAPCSRSSLLAVVRPRPRSDLVLAARRSIRRRRGRGPPTAITGTSPTASTPAMRRPTVLPVTCRTSSGTSSPTRSTGDRRALARRRCHPLAPVHRAGERPQRQARASSSTTTASS